MSKAKSIFLKGLCVCALVASTVLGTIAYLTDKGSVTNTFTVGNIDLTLDETVVNEDGQPVDESGNLLTDEEDYIREEKGNEYHLVPGKSYLKDPTVTVKANSEESYVRMILTIYNQPAVQDIVDNTLHGLNGDYKGLLTGWNDQAWRYVDYKLENNTISFEFRYNGTVVGAATDTKLPALFTHVQVPGTLTNDELKALYGVENDATDDFKMVVEAHAIQAATFVEDTANNKTAEDVAWEAFDAQYAPKP